MPRFDVDYHISLIAIAVLVVISNSFVILLFVCKEKLRTGGKLLLFSLAISDVTTGLVTIPLNIGCEVTFSLELCMTSGMLNRFLAVSTVFHILAVTFETYYAILWPMEHKVKVEKKKILGIVAVIWLVSLIISLVPLTWAIGTITSITQRPTDQFYFKMAVYEIFVMSFAFFIPLVMMFVAHARMFRRIAKALDLMRRRSPNACKNRVTRNNYKSAVLSVLLFVFTLCWVFWFITSLLKTLRHVRHPLPLWLIDALTIVRYTTSFINPLLYTFFRPDFHTAFKLLWIGRKRRMPSITVTYIPNNNSNRTNRESQVTGTFFQESSTTPILFINTVQEGGIKPILSSTDHQEADATTPMLSGNDFQDSSTTTVLVIKDARKSSTIPRVTIDESQETDTKPMLSINGSHESSSTSTFEIDESQETDTKPMLSINGSHKLSIAPTLTIDESQETDTKPMLSINGSHESSSTPTFAIDESQETNTKPMLSINGTHESSSTLTFAIDESQETDTKPMLSINGSHKSSTTPTFAIDESLETDTKPMLSINSTHESNATHMLSTYDLQSAASFKYEGKTTDV
ncbi:LOW QUALITY PROTEIN: substance-K receptor-like [Xenia sp. Carnegie-2017]|uniref:LOW QUALITY PROTEIN: substance-K receptor-like n=1 Tax=Xenia sp. Carnegie-2017 TaxID=2897299 RepID=UPI001F033204|nr:LOW QUALITY PROTEIN: substance-K receptor-like [Xenia sp. Carnegie-2017]